MYANIPTPEDLRPTKFRNGDDREVNVGPGEMVVPTEVLKAPGVHEAISGAILAMGGNPQRYVVGSKQGSYNPKTGNQEFFWDDIKDFVQENPWIQPIATIGASLLPGGQYIAPIVSGLGTYAGGGSVGQSLGAAAGTAVGQYLAGGYDATPASDGTFAIKADELAQIPESGTASWYTGPASSVSNWLSSSADAVAGGDPTWLQSIGQSIGETALTEPLYATLGSGIGGAIGGMVDPPELNYEDFGPSHLMSDYSYTYDMPASSNVASALTLPSAQSASQVAASQATPIPSGVSYLSPVTNRDTGRTTYSPNAFGSNFLNDRRSGLQNVISV